MDVNDAGKVLRDALAAARDVERFVFVEHRSHRVYLANPRDDGYMACWCADCWVVRLP